MADGINTVGFFCFCESDLFKPFFRYYLATALAALAMGIQIIVIPWLATGELHLASQELAWVQAAGFLPVFGLMLQGGAWADKPRSAVYLPYLYLILALLHFGLLYCVTNQHLVFSVLLFYAVLVGCAAAFIQPLREKLLPTLQKNNRESSSLQLSVIQVGLGVYISQAIGITIAGRLEMLTTGGVILIQSLVVLCVVFLLFSLRLNRTVVLSSDVSEDTADYLSTGLSGDTTDVRSGLTFVWSEPVLRQLIILVTFNGFMHIGVFIVVLPIMVRDIYGLGAGYFAGLQLCFVVGNIAAAIGLLKRGKTEYPGRDILFSLLYSGLLMIAISAGPKTTGLYFLVFFWGVVAGQSASLGKALLQQKVIDVYRGRAISIYSLALFGAAPLGALSCGYALQYVDAYTMFLIAGVLTLMFFVCFLFSKTLWKTTG